MRAGCEKIRLPTVAVAVAAVSASSCFLLLIFGFPFFPSHSRALTTLRQGDDSVLVGTCVLDMRQELRGCPIGRRQVLVTSYAAVKRWTVRLMLPGRTALNSLTQHDDESL